MRKILTSLGMVVFAGAIALGATGAFFSDTETSTGNTFTAGDIDLQIDNESYVTATSTIRDEEGELIIQEAGELIASPWTSWDMTDLIAGTHHFFDFTDLKPGDVGEDTISIHVGSNDAWMCAAARITSDLDNSMTEPEDESSALTGDGTADGDLDTALNFMFWHDDGDNVLEDNEIPFLNGSLASMGAAGQIRLADSTGGILGSNTPIPGDTTFYIGKAWCYGALSAGTVQQDGFGKIGTNGPLSPRGTGVVCNGAAVGNEGQTDSVVGDMQFYATQSRNNSTFTCAQYTPTWPQETQRVTVGAALGAYVAPNCTATVTDGNSIQAVIDVNAAGSTICVGPGTHDSDTYPLRVNEDNMSLVSTAGAATTILNGGVILDNDGTKVMGFTIPNSTLLGETFGVYINTGADGVVVSHNDMNGPGGVSRGVVNAIGVTNALIANNEISNYLTGVFMNPSSGMIVELNDLISNGVGSANDNPTGNIVRRNQITGNTIEGIGVLSVGANSIAVNFNNIFGNGGTANELNSYDAVDPVDAENNWWGDATPADEIGGVGAAAVDFTPFEVAAFVQN